MTKGRRRMNVPLKKQVAANRKAIKKQKRQIEWKYIEVPFDDTNINTTGKITCLNPVAQSAGASTRGTRIGNQTINRKLTIRGVFDNSHGTEVDAIVRMIIFKSKDVSNVLPALTTVLSVGNWRSHRNFDELYNIDVKYDVTFGMDTSQHTLIPFKYTLKMNNKAIYDAAGGTYTAVEANGYYMLLLSQVEGTDHCPVLNAISRFYFQDP